MINIIINGANGKMGKNVFNACLNTDGVNAVCGVDRAEDFSNPNFPVYDSLAKVQSKVDVLIDFSSPNSLDGILDFCLTNKTPAVLCSTGYTEQDIEKINQASKSVAIFRSANMSLGINAILDVVKTLTKSLYGFDIEIVEKHHNKKVDSPSGTALMLANAVKDADQQKFFIYGREGICGARKPNEVGIHAIRGGNIVGEHQVIFAGEDETITLTHQATDRKVFAYGAVKAGQFIKDKPAGLYDMADVIKESL